MIAANELRIGNWVATGGYQVRVTSLSDKFCHTTARERLVLHSIDFLHPIPLTPTILEKCGFEKSSVSNGVGYILQLKDGFYLQFLYLKAAKEWKEFLLVGNGGYDEPGELNIVESCQYLHQLQNLYFALTQTELNIQL